MPDRTCSIDGCERPHYGRGWCNMHYQRNKPPKQTGPCSVEGCDAPNHAQGLCAKHRARVKRHGSVDATLNRAGCTVDGCEGRHKAHGLCAYHYDRTRPARPKPDHGPCSIDGCESPAYQRGWCSAHYARWWRNGDPLIMTRPTFGMTRDEAFRHYMPEPPPPAPSPTEGCWLWRGGVSGDPAYGAFRADKGTLYKAHRVSYELYVGPIPAGLLIRHTCDVTLCCQPAHLEPGDDAANNRDMMKRGRNRQPKGEAQAMAKLTDDAVREIRAAYASGQVSQQQLADHYGVYQTVISKVVLRRGWKHVD